MATLKTSPKFPEIYAARQGGASIIELSERYGYAESTLRSALKTPLAQSTPPPQAAPPESEWRLTPTPVAPAKQATKQPQKAPSHGGKWKRFVICSDVHGDEQHEPTVEVFFDFCEKHWKPELRIMAGDLWDFRPLRGGVSEEERTQDMTRDYQAGRAFLERMRPQYFLRGNHDERLWEMRGANDGVRRQFAYEKTGKIEEELAALDIKMLPYHILDGILQLGHLKVAHGFYNGVQCAKQMADTYESIIFGHNHAIISHPVPGMQRRAARCIGSMCNNIMGYNARRPSALRMANGFAYGVLNEATGVYHIWQAESQAGEWLLPGDLVELSA